MTQYVSYINANADVPRIEGVARPLPRKDGQRRRSRRNRIESAISLFDFFSRQTGPGGFADFNRKI